MAYGGNKTINKDLRHGIHFIIQKQELDAWNIKGTVQTNLDLHFLSIEPSWAADLMAKIFSILI